MVWQETVSTVRTNRWATCDVLTDGDPVLANPISPPTGTGPGTTRKANRGLWCLQVCLPTLRPPSARRRTSGPELDSSEAPAPLL